MTTGEMSKQVTPRTARLRWWLLGAVVLIGWVWLLAGSGIFEWNRAAPASRENVIIRLVDATTGEPVHGSVMVPGDTEEFQREVGFKSQGNPSDGIGLEWLPVAPLPAEVSAEGYEPRTIMLHEGSADILVVRLKKRK